MRAGCWPSLRKLGEQTDSLPTVEPPVDPPNLPAASPTHIVHSHYTFDTYHTHLYTFDLSVNMIYDRYMDTKVPLENYCAFKL